jgi:NodT family efflux transporter outer membrane factor (OMF) lipoprotein
MVAALLLAGCTQGPDYHRPAVTVPPAYKELPPGWKVASPRAEADRGAWWTVYHDPALDDLERRVDVDNQNLKASEASYRQALALVREARSNLFPTLELPSRGQSTSTSGTVRLHQADATVTRNTAGIIAGWDLDIWGKIRRQIESQHAAAQASAADLAAARLSTEAELATDYFDLRSQDSLAALLDDNIAALTRSLEIVRNQYRLGAADSSDVAAAETQLQTSRAQRIAVGVGRARYEHAIALLVGRTPDALTIPVAPLTDAIPDIPVLLPSELLERRPDIAAAEREMQSENARIGVAIAAFFPDISLGAGVGFSGPGALFKSANEIWGIAGSMSGTLLDAGGRSASVAAAQATYQQSVAQFRETVLAAFQQTEDALSSVRILGEQAAAQDAAVSSAQRSVDTALREYRAGAQAYTAVVTAQLTALSNRQAALQIRQSRLVASVDLLKALGGGWQRTDLQS